MEIIVNKRGPKEYYEEFLYILYEYRRFLKKPTLKAYQFTKRTLTNIFLGLFGIGLMLGTYFGFKDNDIIFLSLSILLLLVTIITIMMYVQGKKRMEVMMNDTQEKIITLNEEGVSYKDADKLYKLAWNQIGHILINKYSVTFLPASTDTLILSLSIEYLDDILKGLEEVNKKELIVDNRSLYN